MEEPVIKIWCNLRTMEMIEEAFNRENKKVLENSNQSVNPIGKGFKLDVGTFEDNIKPEDNGSKS